MAIEKPAPWIGASGNEYLFHVYGLEPDVPKRLGSYIYAKRNEGGAWVPVFMGHGDLDACCTDPARRRCIAAKAATHIHLRLNGREADREAELQDLLAHYANAFEPEGCHPAVTTTPSTTTAGSAHAGVAGLETPATRRRPAAKKTAAKKTAAKKTAAKKATAKKTAARAPAKKTAAKKTATKTPAKKAASKATRNAPVKTRPKTPRPPSK